MAKKKKNQQLFNLGALEPFNLSTTKMQPLNMKALSAPVKTGSSAGSIAATTQGKGYDGPFAGLIGAGKFALDVLQAPSRAVGGTIAEIKEDGFQPLDIPKGVLKAGDSKYDPSDVLEVDNFWGGLAVDIGLDPLTYLTAGVGGVIKGGVTATAKGAGKALGKKSAKEIENVAKVAKKEVEDELRETTRKLSGLKDEATPLKEFEAKVPKTKVERAKRQKKVAEFEDVASKARKGARKAEQSIAPRFISKQTERIGRATEKGLENRRALFAAGSIATNKAKAVIRELDQTPKPREQMKTIRDFDNKISKAVSERSATKIGTPERVAKNQEIFDLRQARKAEEQAFTKATNAKSSQKQAVTKAEAEDLLAQGQKAMKDAVVDTFGNPVLGLGKLENVADETVSLAQARQQISRAAKKTQKAENKADKLRQTLPEPEDVMRIDEDAQRLWKTADDASEQAAQERRFLDADSTQVSQQVRDLDNQIDELQTVEDRLRARLEAFKSLTVEDWARNQDKIVRLVDTPAMRDLAPDMVQRRLKFAPMGINIPGISDALSIPLGRIYSKSARKAAFTKRFPGLAKIRDSIGETFNPIYNIAPVLADLERGRANLAKATADRALAKSNDYRNLLSADEMSTINQLLYKADDLGLDLINAEARVAGRAGDDIAESQRLYEEAVSAQQDVAAAKAKLADARAASKGVTEASANLKAAQASVKAVKEAKKTLDEGVEAQRLRDEVLDTFDNLSENGREAVEYVLGTYRKDAELDFALGLIDNIKEGYSSRLRPLGDADQQIMRSNDVAMITEKGFAKSRTVDNVEEEIDFLEAFSLRQIQAAQMRQGYGMINSLSQEVGQKFASKADAEAAGFFRPDKGKAAEWLGDDVYIPREIAESLDRLHEVWTSPRALGGFMRKWTVLNGMFKNLAYTINPGHFLIDSIGDSWNMFLAKVPLAHPTYGPKAITALNKIESYDKARAAGKPFKDTKIDLGGGKEVEIEDIILLLDAKGLRNRGRSTGRTSAIDNQAGEYLLGTPKYGRRANPRRVARAGAELVQKGGNFRDNTFRSYGLLVQLQKNMDDGMEFSLALNSAGNTIRFSTFDYNDLTPVEKRIFRNIMPFYTWTRKNIPYQLNRLMEVPGRVTLPLNVQEASFEQEGAPDLSMLQPFTRDTNFLLPQGVTDKIPFVGGAPLYVNPMIPSMDLGRFQTYRIKGEEGFIPGVDVAQGIGMLSPYMKAFPELAMNREFFSGREIGSSPSYLLRTFMGQPGSQVVRQLAPNTSGYDETGLLNRRRNQVLGLTGQLLGFRGYSVEEGPARRARAARLQSIKIRQAEKENARREAGNLFTLPLFGQDVKNPFYY